MVEYWGRKGCFLLREEIDIYCLISYVIPALGRVVGFLSSFENKRSRSGTPINTTRLRVHSALNQHSRRIKFQTLEFSHICTSTLPKLESPNATCTAFVLYFKVSGNLLKFLRLGPKKVAPREPGRALSSPDIWPDLPFFLFQTPGS